MVLEAGRKRESILLILVMNSAKTLKEFTKIKDISQEDLLSLKII
jgi:hypothetical protein